MSHREYLSWQVRLSDELNEPSRTDHYLMRVIWELMQFNGKKPTEESVKVKFTRKGEQQAPTAAQIAMAKSKWRTGMGITSPQEN